MPIMDRMNRTGVIVYYSEGDDGAGGVTTNVRSVRIASIKYMLWNASSYDQTRLIESGLLLHNMNAVRFAAEYDADNGTIALGDRIEEATPSSTAVYQIVAVSYERNLRGSHHISGLAYLRK